MKKRFQRGRSWAALLVAIPLAVSLAACASPEDDAGVDVGASDGDAVVAEVEVEAPPADDEGAPAGDAEAADSAEVLGCAAFVENEELFVSAADVAAAVDDPSCLPGEIVFVDARPTLDYQSGHIPDAVNAPYHSVAGYLDELPMDKWLVVYCECPRAEAVQAARALTGDHGYTKVKVIEDGLGGWRELGREIVGSVETES